MLEMRQVTNTNAELFYQNGQIISATLLIVAIAGIMVETSAMLRKPKKRLRGRIRPSGPMYDQQGRIRPSGPMYDQLLQTDDPKEEE
jgi:hypothetical protein